jgi:hypothetical protein
MKPAPTLLQILLCLLAFVMSAVGAESVGTAFTYQGRLTDKEQPADGRYDFQFSLYDTDVDGEPLRKPVLIPEVQVLNGLFTVGVDFGTPFTGGSRWLQVEMRPSGEPDFSALTPRQFLSAVPHAGFADTAGTAVTVPATNLSGKIPDSRLSANVVLNGSSPAFYRLYADQIAGDGASLSNTIPANSSVTRAKLAPELQAGWSTAGSGITSGLVNTTKDQWTFLVFIDNKTQPQPGVTLAASYTDGEPPQPPDSFGRPASPIVLRRPVPPDPAQSVQWNTELFWTRPHEVIFQLKEYNRVYSSWGFTDLMVSNYTVRVASDGLPVEQIKLFFLDDYTRCLRTNDLHGSKDPFYPKTVRDTVGFTSGYDPAIDKYRLFLGGRPWTNGIIASDITLNLQSVDPDPFALAPGPLIVRQPAIRVGQNPLFGLYDSGAAFPGSLYLEPERVTPILLGTFASLRVRNYRLLMGDDGLPYEELTIVPEEPTP